MRALVAVLAVIASRPAVACPAGMHDETELGPMECAPCARGNTHCPCGQPTIHFCVRGDGKQGSYERQTPDGVVVAAGTFKDGVKEGAWIEGGGGGPLSTAEHHYTYVHGVPDGPAEEHWTNQIAKGRLAKGKKEGHWITTSKTGTVVQEGDYKNDVEVGAWRQFDANGNLIALRLYTPPHVKEELYYPDGTIKSRDEWEGSMKEGVAEMFFPDGTLEWRTGYLHNLENGTTEKHRKDGTLIEKGENKNGTMWGTWQYFAADGKLERTWRRLPPPPKSGDSAVESFTPTSRIVRIIYNNESYEEEYPFITCPAGTKRHVEPGLRGAATEWCEDAAHVKTGPYQSWGPGPTERWNQWRLDERGELSSGKRTGPWVEHGMLTIYP
jgi:antitoxin component YwqK of YwqJK toxin-antitoxin module